MRSGPYQAEASLISGGYERSGLEGSMTEVITLSHLID
jgi:hypothetical protein